MASLIPAKPPPSFLPIRSIASPIATLTFSTAGSNTTPLPSELHRACPTESKCLGTISNPAVPGSLTPVAPATGSFPPPSKKLEIAPRFSRPFTRNIPLRSPHRSTQFGYNNKAYERDTGNNTHSYTQTSNPTYSYGYGYGYGNGNSPHIPSDSSPVQEPAPYYSSHSITSLSPPPASGPSTPATVPVSPELTFAISFSSPVIHPAVAAYPRPDPIMSFTDSARFNSLHDNPQSSHYGPSNHESSGSVAPGSVGLALGNPIGSENTPPIISSYGHNYPSSSGSSFVNQYSEFAPSQPVAYASPGYQTLPIPTPGDDLQPRQRSDPSSSSISFPHQYGSVPQVSNGIQPEFPMMRYDVGGPQGTLLGTTSSATNRSGSHSQNRIPIPSAFQQPTSGYPHSSPSSSTSSNLVNPFYTSPVPGTAHDPSIYSRGVIPGQHQVGNGYQTSDPHLGEIGMNISQQPGHSHSHSHPHPSSHVLPHPYPAHPHAQSHSQIHPGCILPSTPSDPAPGPGVRILTSRPKPQCWEHGCNGREFSTFSNLLRHQREKSGLAAKSNCPRCGAEFTRTTARNGHMAHDKCRKRSQTQQEEMSSPEAQTVSQTASPPAS